ncbi:10796_t:CDS:2 [Entrophospora sp. SA101]|nr:10796_t:CDS:2 [Entrophospora sp. SA101]CAJ0827756.1 5368_t:CDS:2 [Entrophospora sp. SA101]CAJ0865117.1 6002_t:CDS:2 [Entrophospora sp. SA101]CAJ0922137.1 12712_t:CDS:2 [Entrophospora sp. SA101]
METTNYSNKSTYKAVVIFIVVIILLCQSVVSIPVPENQLDENKIETPSIFFVQNPNINEIVNTHQFDEIPYKTTTDFPAVDDITKFFKDIGDAITKFFEFNFGIIIEIVIGIGIFILICLFPTILVGIIRAIGFGVKGIIKGTWAAKCMAAHCGYVVAGSLCSVLQSIGAKGISGLGGLLKFLG